MKLHVEHLKKAAFVLLILVLGIIGSIGCRNNTKAPGGSSDAENQAVFTTPEAAGIALQAAARSGNESALAHILGADSKMILSSGDAEEDKQALASFVTKYDRMNRWVAMTDGTRILYIGVDNYPYPIPLAKNASSQWYFNSAAGKDDVLARRIGKNELLAIDATYAMANAQKLYFAGKHDGNPSHRYALKILSDPGKEDGLYWEVKSDQPSSPLGRLNDFAKDVVATANQGTAPVFDGYSFRILTAQGDSGKGDAKNYVGGGEMTGGFAVIAIPVKYQDSGIMTFILSREGVVYQKDLGVNTSDVAASIAEYNPANGWTPAE